MVNILRRYFKRAFFLNDDVSIYLKFDASSFKKNCKTNICEQNTDLFLSRIFELSLGWSSNRERKRKRSKPLGVEFRPPPSHWGGSLPAPANRGGGKLSPPPSTTLYISFLKKTLIKPDIIRYGCLFFLKVFQLICQPLSGVHTNHIEVILILRGKSLESNMEKKNNLPFIKTTFSLKKKWIYWG